MTSTICGTLLAVLSLGAFAPCPVSAETAETAHDALQGAEPGLFASPQDGGVRRWQVRQGDGASFVPAPGQTGGRKMAAGAVMTQFGCTDEAGDLWCAVRPLGGTERGYMRAGELEPVAGPDGHVARGLDDSGTRAKRKRFDASGQIPCAQEQGQALGLCDVGVARSTGGDATAAVTFANGFTRYLSFAHGRFIRASATMSGAGRDTDWQVTGGVHRIRVDDQRFEIAHALLFGP